LDESYYQRGSKTSGLTLPTVKLKKPLRGVLFDFDGVIGDTMEDNYRAWVHAFGLYGASFSQREYFLLEGDKVDNIASRVLTEFGKDPALGKDVAQKKDEFYKAHNSFKFSAGIPDAVKILQQAGVKIGCVSGGARRRLINEKTAPILDLMDALVTSDDVTRGKPDPEPYLKGISKLGLPAESVMVVENAPLGVASAKAAGLFCLAVCSTLTPTELKEADFVLEGTSQLPEIFREILKENGHVQN
jgi:beta-phosphoglucomutase